MFSALQHLVRYLVFANLLGFDHAWQVRLLLDIRNKFNQPGVTLVDASGLLHAPSNPDASGRFSGKKFAQSFSVTAEPEQML